MDLNSLWQNLSHPTELIKALSYPGIFAIIFSETAFLVGFFLPGDTLLLSAGALTAGNTPLLSLGAVIPTIIVAAIAGDTSAYFIGRRYGPALFRRPESRFFKPEYMEKAEVFFAKYGAFTLTMAKFVPVIRAFAPTLAGTSGMPYSRFIAFSALGAVLWASSLTTLAHFLAALIPPELLDKYVLAFVGVVLLTAIGVSLFAVFSGRRVH